MHSERVNELEWNNRPIKVFIELSECGSVDTEVQIYQLLSRSQARLLFLSASTALLSWTIFHQALSSSNASYQLKIAEGSFRCHRRYWHSASNSQKSTQLVEGIVVFRNKIAEIKERRGILPK